MTKTKPFYASKYRLPALLTIGILTLLFGNFVILNSRNTTLEVEKTGKVTSDTLAGTRASQGIAPEVSPNKTSSETAVSSDKYDGWKTYVTDWGVTFKYPSSWKVTDSSIELGNDLSLRIESNPSKFVDNFSVDFHIYDPGVSAQYSASEIQKLGNGLRIWLLNSKLTSKYYMQDAKPQEFECAEMRLLDKEQPSGVRLTGGQELNSSAGFCQTQNFYTLKSLSEQTGSQEWKNAVALYESIVIR